MARRKKKQRKQLTNQREHQMYAHINRLGLSSFDEYTKWCERRGFPTRRSKSAAELKRELRSRESHADAKDLARSRFTRNPLAVVRQVCFGELDPRELLPSSLREVCQRIPSAPKSKNFRRSLFSFLEIVDTRTDLLLETTTWGGQPYRYVDALITLHQHRRHWIRPMPGWRVKTHNRHRQFASLVRHLIARYPVPLFFDSVWFRRESGSSRGRDWYLHVGAGKNLRTAESDADLTKKIVHHMLGAPDDYTLEQAVRWGQIHVLGGERRLCEAVNGTRLGTDLGNDEFWQSVLRFFVDYPTLDRALVGPIVDFLHHQRFEADYVTVDGRRRQLPAPQANLSMSRRTPGSLIRQMEAWHRRLGRSGTPGDLRWGASGIGRFRVVTGKGEKQVIWRVDELLSKGNLVREGRRMTHCVATYAQMCARGHCSIWSMTREDVLGQIRHIHTLEVTRDRVIVQARGRHNQLPNLAQTRIIKAWARQEDLSIVCYGVSAD